eukprot:scaffold83152_cov35-Phaeocystis_antarctica.AAC.2
MTWCPCRSSEPCSLSTPWAWGGRNQPRLDQGPQGGAQKACGVPHLVRRLVRRRGQVRGVDDPLRQGHQADLRRRPEALLLRRDPAIRSWLQRRVAGDGPLAAVWRRKQAPAQSQRRLCATISPLTFER